MSEPHVVSALRAKRAEVSSYIKDLERKIANQRANLAHIDATIKIFSPATDPDAIQPKRTYRRSRYFAKGEISRAIFAALRKANGQPIKASIIVDGLVAAKGFQSDDAALIEAMTERVLVVLRRLAKQGAVTKSGTTQDAQWSASSTWDERVEYI